MTTTSAIEGWSVQQYLGPIAMHRVAGTGMFSDLFAEFSDVFGGRSAAYRQQLESLYSEAITELVRAAEARGGNWVLGLHVDFDEISGKGKQMFMLSALGTAVRARRDASHADTPLLDDILGVSSLEVSAVMREQGLLSQLARKQAIDADAWDFLAERRNTDAIADAVDFANATAVADTSEVTASRKAAGRYLRALPANVVSEILFRLLRERPDLMLSVLSIVREMRLGRFDLARACFDAPDPLVRWAVFQSLKAAPQSYLYDDIALLDEIRVLIPTILMPLPLVSRERMFGGQKQLWQCVCGNQVSLNSNCSQCSRNRLGIGPRDLSPENAMSLMQSRIDALRAIYQRRL